MRRQKLIWPIILILLVSVSGVYSLNVRANTPEQNVEIDDVNGTPSFIPANITILQGTTLNWTNNDTDESHTVTSDTNIFNSSTLVSGQSFNWTFNNTGTFPYHCSFHPSMRGNVTVISAISTFNISGYKINDTNGNGVRDANETGIADWNITVSNATIQKTIKTDLNGYYNFTNLVNGSYNVSEEVKAGWRNTSATLKTIVIAGQDTTNVNFTNQIVNDTVLPTVNSVILNNSNPTAGQSILVTVNATDNIGVVNVTANNVGLTQVGNIWNGTIIAEAGNHTVNVTARDAAGNIGWNNSTTYIGVVSDTILPEINSVVLNTSTPIAGDNILVTVNATDNIGIVNVTANNIALTNRSGNIWNGTIIAQAGNHSVNVSARDLAGNVRWHNLTTYTGIVNDTTPPTINSVELNATTPFTGDSILVSVNATDNVGVTNVSANNVNLPFQTGNSWVGTIIAQEGNHSVNVSARDLAGNVIWNNLTTYIGMNTSIRFVFVVDRPAIAINQTQNALYILTINNTGQVNDTYNLTIDNPNNANVSISQRNISLSPGNSSNINLTVNSSIPGTYIVNVTATSRANPLLSRIVTTTTKVLSPSYVRAFGVGNGTRAGNITANATVTNLGNETHWFVVVISGVNPTTGYPLVGTGTVRLDANQTIRVPVLITVPASASLGRYQLFAGIYPFDEEILDPDTIIGTIQGPVISTIS